MKAKTIKAHLEAIPCRIIREMALKATSDYDSAQLKQKVFYSANALEMAFSWENNSVFNSRDFWKAVHLELNLIDEGKTSEQVIQQSLNEYLHEFYYEG